MSSAAAGVPGIRSATTVPPAGLMANPTPNLRRVPLLSTGQIFSISFCAAPDFVDTGLMVTGGWSAGLHKELTKWQHPVRAVTLQSSLRFGRERERPGRECSTQSWYLDQYDLRLLHPDPHLHCAIPPQATPRHLVRR